MVSPLNPFSPIGVSPSDARMIAIDWGSTSLRAFLLGANGQVLETRFGTHGISKMKASSQAYSEVLTTLAGDWLDVWPRLPILACGMVGSKHGWQDVPYVACPANSDQIAAGTVYVTSTDHRRVHIVPGLLYRSDNATPDVMRGEETQIIGALQMQSSWSEHCCIVMPGTHSKWAHICQAQVLEFATHMTGELFAVLREHSVLGRLMTSVESHAGSQNAQKSQDLHLTSFLQGVDAVKDTAIHGLSHLLFSVRSLGLMEDIPASNLADYLSGLLIGHELKAGLVWRSAAGLTQAPLILVGETDLCQRYVQALQRFDVKADAVLSNTAPAGLWRLALSAGLLVPEINLQDSK
ncbi:2-dehydro-3-deoxygalactonokinase [Undibacterium sp. GrIS 1.8]